MTFKNILLKIELDMATSNPQSFISAISSFNKELFHSRAIVWLLNELPKFQNAFLKSILDTKEYNNVIFIKALSEIRQLDVLVICKLDNKYKFIHLENKIKASEATKKNKKEYTASKEEILSQTEFYFSRLSDKKFRDDLAKEIMKEINSKDISESNLKTNPESNWSFVFLKPSHTLRHDGKMETLNRWRHDIWERGNISNPWVTKSYKELIFDTLANITNLPESVNEYALLLKDEFTSLKKNLGHEDFLCLKNVNLAVNTEKMNAIENSTLEEWFKKLEIEINETHSNILDLKESALGVLGFDAKFITDTGNNSGFLIEASYLITDFQFPKNKELNLSTARIGIQYEHNMKSAKMKFFFAAHEYDKIKIPDTLRPGYNKKVKSFLGEENFMYLSNKLKWDDKFNGSKGKSFCSRAVDIKEYKSYKELRDMFNDYIRALKKDLIKMNNKVWKEFSQS